MWRRILRQQLCCLPLHHKEVIEKKLGFTMTWDKLEGKKASRIKHSINGLNFDDHSNYPELMNETINAAVAMRDTFKNYI